VKVCKFCNIENADEAKFCVSCGKDLTTEPTNYGGWIVIGLIVMIGLYNGIWGLKDAEDVKVVSWHISGETVHIDLYNGSDYVIKEISPTLYVYEKGSSCKEGDKDIDRFKFKIKLDKENFFSPFVSKSYSINAGAVLTSDKYASCKRISVSCKGN
jgi:hypothetical protein